MQELAETHQRVIVLTASLSDVITRDEAPIMRRRTRRALNAAAADGRRVIEMLGALDRSYPVSATAVAS